ncbi:MAG: hypothetical protein ACJAY7_000668 [Pseudohongiellaceae bacterium]|jgi:hypothetical protein
MKKITTADLLTPEAYEVQRPAIHQAILEHKKTRRVPLGPNATLHFEDYMVMRYQILETIRAEKLINEAGLLEELEAYNPLIPDGKNLKATFMLEFPDEAQRRERLGQLIGIEDIISIQIEDMDPIFGIANEDLPRPTDENTSAVFFLRFELSDDMIVAAKAGAAWYIRSEHLSYQHLTDALPDAISKSLRRDLD